MVLRRRRSAEVDQMLHTSLHENYFYHLPKRHQQVMDGCVGNKFPRRKSRRSRTAQRILIPGIVFCASAIPANFRRQRACRHPHALLFSLPTTAYSAKYHFVSFLCVPEWKNEWKFHTAWIWSMKFQTILKLKYDFSPASASSSFRHRREPIFSSDKNSFCKLVHFFLAPRRSKNGK